MKNTKSYIDYSQAIDDVYEYLEDYYLTKKTRVFIVFDDMMADMDSNKKLSPIVQSYFKGPKTAKLNATHYFFMKILNKSELQKIASHHLSNNDYISRNFLKIKLKNHIHF